MALFLSTYHNKLDKKGRISVPALFRAALSQQAFSGIVAYGSFVNPCVEACGMDRIEKLSRRIETLDPFSDEHDAFSTTILGGSVQLAFDGEGRITLPEHLIEFANIGGEAIFVGKGETFEIWEPEAFRAYAERARAVARDQRLKLRSANPGEGV